MQNGGGNVNAVDECVEKFVALFEGDILAAHEALSLYEHERAKRPAPVAKSSPYDNNEVVVSLQNITKSYKLGRQKVEALRDVSVIVRKSEFVAITGTSGSGKSTLLHILGCLDKPTSGRVTIEGQDTMKLSDAKLSELRKRTIGFIFQSFYLQPFLHLDDNVTVPAMFTNKKKKDIDAQTASLLEQVGLADRAKHFPKELSGGQIQRAAIARALVNTPSILLADEPTGNLDSANGQAILSLFRMIREKLGTTIIVVTHDAAIAHQADRVITLKDGAVV